VGENPEKEQSYLKHLTINGKENIKTKLFVNQV